MADPTPSDATATSGKRPQQGKAARDLNATIRYTSWSVFRAVDPPSVADPQLGWGRYAMRGVTVVDIPGHHLNLIESWRAGVLGSRVATALDSVTQRDAEASLRSSDHPA